MVTWNLLDAEDQTLSKECWDVGDGINKTLGEVFRISIARGIDREQQHLEQWIQQY